MLLTYSGKSHHNCRPTYSFYIVSLEFPSVVMVTNVLQIYLHVILNGLGYSPCMLQTQCSLTRISPFFENLGEYSVIRLISSRSVRFVINVLIAKSYNIYIYIYIYTSTGWLSRSRDRQRFSKTVLMFRNHAVVHHTLYTYQYSGMVRTTMYIYNCFTGGSMTELLFVCQSIALTLASV